MQTKFADIGLGFITIVLLALILWCVYHLLTAPYQPVSFWSQLALILTSAGILVWLWRYAFREPAPQTKRSLVLLFHRPLSITLAHLHQVTEDVFSVQCAAGILNAPNTVVQTPSGFSIRVTGYTFVVNYVNAPYFDQTKTTSMQGPDIHLQQILRDQIAWLSVTLLDAPRKATPHDIDLRLDRLTTALADDACIGRYSPETMQLSAWHPDHTTVSKDEVSLQAVEKPVEVPALRVTVDDEHMEEIMEEAAQEATSQWGTFVNAFAHRTPEQTFAVKAPFTDGNELEYMWVIVTDLSEETITGTLDNAPILLRNFRDGDTVTVDVDQVNDWLYTDHGEVVGSFTTKALEKQHSEVIFDDTTKSDN